MSYSQYSLRNVMDISSLFGTMLGTILQYQQDPCVHPQWSRGIPDIGISSYSLSQMKSCEMPPLSSKNPKKNRKGHSL